MRGADLSSRDATHGADLLKEAAVAARFPKPMRAAMIAVRADSGRCSGSRTMQG
jgi:hypothetical protein